MEKEKMSMVNPANFVLEPLHLCLCLGLAMQAGSGWGDVVQCRNTYMNTIEREKCRYYDAGKT